MIKIIFVSISTILFSTQVFARGYRGDSNDFINLIIGFIFVIGSLFFYIYSYLSWQERQQCSEKPTSKDGLLHWIFILIGYAIIAFFASIPITLIAKFLIQTDEKLTILTYTFFIMFSLLLFLRRT
ncbi:MULTISPECIES: putative four-helix membrane protein [Acinetobacter]|uniref:putative four-helix membrane protein n=1 Tax=Acinetobacter TaxID=469 RepID=UPI00384DD00D